MFSCLIYLLIYLFNFRFTQPCTPTPRLQSGAKLLRLEGLDGRKAAGMCGSSPRTKSLAHRSSVREERGEEEKKKGKKEAKKGRWKVSVRNASLLEDNPRAGPVCFKSNQSIRINYPCAPHPTLLPSPPYRVARAGTRTRGGWGVCVLCFLSRSLSLHTLIHTPNPHLLSEKEPIKIKL